MKLIEDMMMENIPNLARKQTYKPRKHIPNKMGPKRLTPRHIIIKTPKFKVRES